MMICVCVGVSPFCGRSVSHSVTNFYSYLTNIQIQISKKFNSVTDYCFFCSLSLSLVAFLSHFRAACGL